MNDEQWEARLAVHRSLPGQQIRYCYSADGVRIAYATVGEGPPLVKAANWLSHLEYDWQSPVWRHWLQGLAQHHHLIRYDERGCGLSDWDVDNMSFEDWLSDLEAVVDAAGVDRFPLLGISQGGAIAVAYAVRHPERVSHLILYGAYARGKHHRNLTEEQREEARVLIDLIKIGWGQENPAFRQVFTSLFMPDGTAEQYYWFNELQRVSSSPENAARIVSAFGNIDVSDLATQVTAPTLLLHAHGDARIPFEEGRLLASLIPGAQFVSLESKNHILLENEPAWALFLDKVFQFLAMEPGAAAAPTPSAASGQAQSPGHITPASTRFIGREPELADIHRLLLAEPDCRLLTLVGPGGIGKTRLALEAAVAAGDAFSHGFYFAALAPLNSAEHLIDTLAKRIGFQFQRQGEPKQQLLDYLRDKKMLLVLDNFEHLLEGATLVTEILEAARDVKMVVTSRERLQLSGETVYTLGGLAYVDWASPTATPAGRSEPSQDVANTDAARLFRQQARLVRPDFQLQEKDIDHLARICHLVQGTPLALVLAAGWLDMLSLAEIAEEISRSPDFLETDLRDLPERQRSMRAVFETSWQRLTPEEQRSLAALSVFRGGFTREAAQAVAGASLPTLRKLVNKSLISLRRERRYEMHELLRHFAAERLQGGLNVHEQTYKRHAAYYTTFLRQRTEALKRARQKQTLAEITADLDNIRAAWRWAIEQRDVQAIEEAAESLYYFSDIRGGFHEGDASFQQALTALRAPEGGVVGENEAALVGFLLVLQGWMRSERGHFDQGQNLIEEGLSLIRQAKPDPGQSSDTLTIRTRHYQEAFALMHLGWVLHERNKSLEARQRGQAALSLFAEIGDRWGELLCQLLLATIVQQEGDLVGAEQYAQACLLICQEIGERREKSFALMVTARNAIAWGDYMKAGDDLEQALQIGGELDDPTSKAKALRDLGALAIAQGDYGQAVATLRQCLSILNEIGSTWLLGSAQNYLGTALRLQGDFDGAARCYQDSLALSQALGHPTDVAMSLSNWACLAYDQGHYQQAKKSQLEALTMWQQLGNVPEMASSLRYLGYIATAAGEGQEGEARQYFSQALQRALKHRLAPLALDVFVGQAELALPNGGPVRDRPQRAVELLALAESHLASTQQTREEARRRLKRLEATLPAAEMQRARTRGMALDWQAVADSLILHPPGHVAGHTPSGLANQLPARSTPLIGREPELADIRRLLLAEGHVVYVPVR